MRVWMVAHTRPNWDILNLFAHDGRKVVRSTPINDDAVR